MGSQKTTANTKVNDSTCTEAHVRHWRGVDLTGDLSMSDQGVLPKLISNITSDLSRAPDLPRRLSDVALHEARFTESRTMVALDLYSSLGRHVSSSLFTRSSSTAHHLALPVSTSGISAQQVPVAVSTGDCCCRGERHVPVTSRLLPLSLRSPAKHRPTWAPETTRKSSPSPLVPEHPLTVHSAP